MPFQFPAIFAGERLTAGLLQDMIPQFVASPTSTTRTATIIQAADPFLVFPVNAGGLYWVEFNVIYAGVTAAGISTTWTLPSASSGIRTCLGPGNTATSSNANNISVNLAAVNFNTVMNYGCVTGSVTSFQNLREQMVFTAASTGNVSFCWAQTTSSATGTVVSASSSGLMYQLQ